MLLEGSRRSVRSLRLTGLETDASEQLLAEKEVVGIPQDRVRLVEVYAGNPLALNIVAETIVGLFGGEIAPFLEQGEVIFGSVRELLDEQFDRLSAVEQTVLLWLAILREPVTLEELSAVLATPLSRGQVLEAVEALRRRSLLERGKRPGSFTLQAVVLEYASGRCIAEAASEIEQGRLTRLIEQGLELATSKDYVRQTQERLIVAPLLAQVQRVYLEQAAVEEHLLALLDQQRIRADSAQGYGPTNLLALLRQQRGHLRSLNLSQLVIRGASLQGVEMQDTTLSGATLRETLWTSALDAIWTVATSKSGQYWAAGSRQGEVRVWREQGKLLHLAWQAHTSTVATIAFSPDEGTLATGSWDGAIKLWDIESGTLVWTSWHTDNIQRLAFAPDGRTLASSGADGVIQILEAHRGTHLRTLSGHSGPVYALAWSPDGSLLTSGGFDTHIRLWDFSGAQPGPGVRMLVGHSDWVFALAFTPDGRTLASGSWNGTVKFWEVASRRVRETISGHTGRVWAVAWSPDGRTVASCEWDHTIWLWDVERSSYRAVLHGHSAGVHGLAFTPDSRSLLSGSDDGTLRVWDAESGQCVRIMHNYAVSLYDMAWSPDGTQLASGGRGRGGSGEIFVWEVSSGQRLRVWSEPSTIVYALAWSPTGAVLLSGGSDGSMRWWDVQSGKCLTLRQGHQGAIQSLRVSPEGRRLASCGDDGAINIWDLHSGEHLRTLRRDRPYERLDISGVKGLTAAQKTTLRALGAMESAPPPNMRHAL